MIRRVLVVLGLALGALLMGAGIASAHDVLTGSTPANGSTVDAMPATVTLTFDQPVQNLDPVLVVTGPNGNVFSTGSATVSGNDVSTSVAAGGPAGGYRAAYRIISADGHPVTGEISFTLSSAGAGTATGSAPTGGTTPDTVSGSSGGLNIWIWLGLGIAALLVVIAVAIALRRPKGPDGSRA